MNHTIDEQGFKATLEDVAKQVFDGKGSKRHGNGKSLKDQIWYTISENVGEGFCLGQAMKKIHELSTKRENIDAWNTEILGAMSYLVFAYLWFNNHQGKMPGMKSVQEPGVEPLTSDVIPDLPRPRTMRIGPYENVRF
jgi:hypothetical protein